jgi:hypothetical protein
MAFSVDQLADLLEILGPAAKSHRAKEARRARRIRHKAQIAIVPCGKDGLGDPVTVNTEDLSLRGMRMLHDREMTVGDEFLVLLPRKKAEPLQVLCIVAHCTSIGEGLFSIGAAFVCVPEGDPIATRDADLERIRKSILN